MEETTLTPSDAGSLQETLKEKSKVPAKKETKLSKTQFIVAVWKGLSINEVDFSFPTNPVKSVKDIAALVGKAEQAGLFRTRVDIKLERNEAKYLSETKWYLTQAAKKGLIDRKYTPRIKKAVDSTPSPVEVTETVGETMSEQPADTSSM